MPVIRAGANINAVSKYGVTPFALAADQGSTAVLDLLMKAGAKPNDAVNFVNSGETPLMHAARSAKVDAVRLLARAGAPDRRAHYTCVLAAVRAADDPEPLIADARWHGEILTAPRGTGGFGYDPLFLLPALGLTAAELDPAEKNRISHRGQAMAELARKMAAAWAA